MTDKVLPADTSPEALLKQAVTGAKATAQKAAAASPAAVQTKAGFRMEPHLAGFTGGALALGLVLGAGATYLAGGSDPRATETIAQVQSRLETGHLEAERLHGQMDRLAKSLSQMQESAEASRTETKARGATLADRVARTEQALTAKIAALGEKIEQAEKEQNARLAALADRKPTPQASTTAAPAAVKATAPEPAETGAIADKPKPAASENWAVREVYDGVAMLEDRKRRLVEVGPGDTVPGVGRIESIERRGKSWVVVTRQGIIMPQTW